MCPVLSVSRNVIAARRSMIRIDAVVLKFDMIFYAVKKHASTDEA